MHPEDTKIRVQMKEDWSWKPPKASFELERELLKIHGTACMPQALRDELKSHGITWNRKGWRRQAMSLFRLEKKYKQVKYEADADKRDAKRQRRARRRAKKLNKVSGGFYSSWEWKKARFETLKRYGAVCMLCGSEERIVVDHIRPRSRFPELELDLDNLQVLCNDCNMGKSNDDYTDFRPKGTELSKSELIELEIVEEADKWH